MKILLVNKKLNFNYFVIEQYEAGIELKGYEVKSLVISNANIDQAFAVFKKNEVWILNMYIVPYQSNQSFNLSPDRNRKLLLHKKEIIKIQNKIKKERLAIVPSKIYSKNNHIKIEICLCKSKHKADKREDIKKRDAQREIKRFY